MMNRQPYRLLPVQVSFVFIAALCACGALLAAQPSSAFTVGDNAKTAGECRTTTSSSSSALAAASGKKGPLGKIGDLLEEAAASAVDSILMQPKRQVPDDLRRVRTQFIAALGDPEASSGTGAEEWGIWRVDPGPRGVYLSQYETSIAGAPDGKTAPAGWTFDPDEFWIEEYGRIMEKPDFPTPPGRYLVTGGREVTTVLTVGPPDQNGEQSWSLADGARLFDVTHLPCRSAKYTPKKGEKGASPADANLADYPVRPGAEMPPIPGCEKRDYAVLFVLAVERDS